MQTRTPRLIGAALCLALAGACKQTDKSVGLVPPDKRVAPLTPGTRAQLEAAGAVCTPNPSGPVLCTWSGGGADCSLTFDAGDALTHLQCTVDSLVYECTRPGQLYVCSWSDDPGCADVYSVDGFFEAYLCGQALQDRINQGGAHDGGGYADATTSPDASPAHDAGGSSDAGAVVCSGLDEVTCSSVPDCRPFYCPTCAGQNFAVCGRWNDPPPPCAPPLCQCAGLNETDCNADALCHAVYIDNNDCGCAPLGCCAHFDRCEEGPADCQGLDLSCRQVEPHCEGPYVVAYEGTCYEGCALSTRCDPRPIDCTGATGAFNFPSFSTSCLVDTDCTAAIHQINCCGTDHALGINIVDRDRFDRAEAICQPQYPGCGCADLGIELDDGNSTPDPLHVGVRCQAQATGQVGTCQTYLVP